MIASILLIYQKKRYVHKLYPKWTINFVFYCLIFFYYGKIRRCPYNLKKNTFQASLDKFF
jgi:hypothetical protein